MAVVGDEILPLVGVEGIAPGDDKVRLLRLSDGNSELLYAVREVEDAVALDGDLIPTDLDPLSEAIPLVGGETVALIAGHALFARHGAEIGKPSSSESVCRYVYISVTALSLNNTYVHS